MEQPAADAKEACAAHGDVERESTRSGSRGSSGSTRSSPSLDIPLPGPPLKAKPSPPPRRAAPRAPLAADTAPLAAVLANPRNPSRFEAIEGGRQCVRYVLYQKQCFHT